MSTTPPLEAAYDGVREHLHTSDTSDEARDQLRSLLWLCAESLERFGLDGMAVRDLADDLTGATMSPALRSLITSGGHR